MPFVIDPGPNQSKGLEIWAWVSVDHKEDEGLLSAQTPIGWTTLVTFSPKLLPVFRTLAKGIAKLSGKRVRLVRFVRAEVLEEIGG